MDQSLSQEMTEATYVVIEPRRALWWLTSFVRVHAAVACAAMLLAIMAAQMFVVVWRKTITVDEIVMIPSAYYHLVAGNYQLVNEHPPLSKIAAGLPLLFVQPDEAKPERLTHPAGSYELKAEYYDSFWADNRARFEQVIFW